MMNSPLGLGNLGDWVGVDTPHCYDLNSLLRVRAPQMTVTF